MYLPCLRFNVIIVVLVIQVGEKSWKDNLDMVIIDGKLRVRICTLCGKPAKIGHFKRYNKMENNNRNWNICNRCYHGMKPYMKPSTAEEFDQPRLLVD